MGYSISYSILFYFVLLSIYIITWITYYHPLYLLCLCILSISSAFNIVVISSHICILKYLIGTTTTPSQPIMNLSWCLIISLLVFQTPHARSLSFLLVHQSCTMLHIDSLSLSLSHPCSNIIPDDTVLVPNVLKYPMYTQYDSSSFLSFICVFLTFSLLFFFDLFFLYSCLYHCILYSLGSHWLLLAFSVSSSPTTHHLFTFIFDYIISQLLIINN